VVGTKNPRLSNGGRGRDADLLIDLGLEVGPLFRDSSDGRSSVVSRYSPPAKAVQSLQTAIDPRWPLIRGDHVPTIGGQKLLREWTP
jgi:hypothetical protein